MKRKQAPTSLVLVVQHFENLEDPRIDRTKRHSLVNVLVMALSGVICGAEGWDEIKEFCESRAGEVVAIDGKTLRGLVRKAEGNSQLHLVHVWATQQKLLLAQKTVNGASGEMAAIPELLGLLDMKGALVTTDANGCTAPVTRAIVDSGADYVLAVKGSRGRFYKHIVDGFASRVPGTDPQHSEVDEAHGRREMRVTTVFTPDAWPWETKNNGAWAGLRTAVRVERLREANGETSSEVQYYASSLPPDPQRIAQAVRHPWSIENHLHWQLDVGFNDDGRAVRSPTAAENLALLARMALTLVRRETSKKAGIARKRKNAGWDTNYLARILTSGIPIT
jgi:predicted transposase YbfD/YdcC